VNKYAIVITILVASYEIVLCGINRYLENKIYELEKLDNANSKKICAMLDEMNKISTSRDRFLEMAIVRRGLIKNNAEVRESNGELTKIFYMTTKMSLMITVVLPIFKIQWDILRIYDHGNGGIFQYNYLVY
jgi:hypothetical protein